MHDIKLIRENPSFFDSAMAKRGVPPAAQQILALDERLRAEQTKLQAMLARRNELAKEIGQKKAKGLSTDDLTSEAELLKSQIPSSDELVAAIQHELDTILSALPNIPSDDVPDGNDENDNVEIKRIGTPREYDFSPQHHYEIGEAIKQMDFEAAVKMSGSRFVILKAELARLERALANFMLDMHTTEFGYTEVSPPYLVKDKAMFSVGQLPKFDADSFLTREGLRLIPTAEVSLTNLIADTILEEQELPLRYTAYTPSFRSEAGSAGRDTRGMIRLHQFPKVELVSITRPQDSEQEHERMLSCAEEVLKRLDIPYRVLLLCAGDASFSSKKTYDIEVWLPGQNKYREISSCSNCGDFQARRMKARYKGLDSRQNSLVHTLNGSALAVGRTLLAILENYQNSDGSVTIPSVLQKYMNGLYVIGGKDDAK